MTSFARYGDGTHTSFYMEFSRDEAGYSDPRWVIVCFGYRDGTCPMVPTAAELLRPSPSWWLWWSNAGTIWSVRPLCSTLLCPTVLRRPVGVRRTVRSLALALGPLSVSVELACCPRRRAW